MKTSSAIKLFALLFLILTANLYSQGTLKGTVTDSLTNDPLFGTNVFLVGTSLGAAVNIEGNYNITNIPYGNYIVRFSYIGFKPKEYPVDINSNKVVELSVQLTADVILGEEIVVSAQAEGQAAAINQQLSSNKIVNVVSEQKIQELPDANAAEALGRLPGVSLTRSGGEATHAILRGLSSKYTAVTLDGSRLSSTDATSSGLDLSSISQSSLAGIELFNSITSDQDGDAVAGAINFVSKKAPSKRVIKVDATGGYNQLDNSAEQYKIVGRYGERFFNDIFGLQLEGSKERTIRSSEASIRNADFTSNDNIWQYSNFTLNYYNRIREREGAKILLDFNTPDGGNIKFNTTYNKGSLDAFRYNRNFPNGKTTSTSVTYNYYDQQDDVDVFNTTLHGENKLFGLETDWSLYFSQSKNETPYDYTMNFVEPSITGVSGIREIPDSQVRSDPTSWIPLTYNNFSKAYIENAYDRTEKNIEKIKSGFINILKKYSLNSDLTGEFKFGAKYNEKGRTHNTTQARAPYYNIALPQYVRLADGSFAEKDFTGTRFENLEISSQRVLFTNFLDASPSDRLIYGDYSLYPLINTDAMKSWRELSINGYKLPGGDPEYTGDDFQPVRDFYDVRERTFAGYLMNTLNIGPEITFIAGLRAENDNNDYHAKYVNLFFSGDYPYPTINEDEIEDTTGNYSETIFLPNFQLIYRPLDFMQVRMASYKALARPNFNYRLPQFVGRNTNGNYLLYFGNVGLKNEEVWNFEVATQFYSNTIGLFTVSAYYKEFKNSIKVTDAGSNLSGVAQEIIDDLGISWDAEGENIPNDGFRIWYPYNSDKPTKVWGFEVSHQANFRFLPGLLKNIILDYNFSIVRTETWNSRIETYSDSVYNDFFKRWVKVTKRRLNEQKDRLPSSPEFFGNIALGYDIGGFSFRISAYHQSSYISLYTLLGKNDQEVKGYTKLDMHVTQAVTDNIKLLLNMYNITNIKDGRIYNSKYFGVEVPYDDSTYGMTLDFGVRVVL